VCDEDKVGEIWGGLGTWTGGEIKGGLVGEVSVGTSSLYSTTGPLSVISLCGHGDK
jgi:hypothetical protein